MPLQWLESSTRSALAPRQGLQAKAGGLARVRLEWLPSRRRLSRGGKLWTSVLPGLDRAGGGGTTHAVSDGVWPPSLALAEVTTTSTAWPDHRPLRVPALGAIHRATARFVRPFWLVFEPSRRT